MCHFNVLPVHVELRRPTRARIQRVLYYTFAFAAVLYTLVAVPAVMTFGDSLLRDPKVSGNILQMFEQGDPLIQAGRVALSATLLFSLPLLVVPTRTVMKNLIRRMFAGGRDSSWRCEEERGNEADTALFSESTSSSPFEERRSEVTRGDEERSEKVREELDLLILDGAEESNVLDADGSVVSSSMAVPLLPSSGSNEERKESSVLESNERVKDWGLTVAIIGLSVIVAILVPNIVVVWSIGGSSAGFLISYVLPPLFYIKLKRNAPILSRKMLPAYILATVAPILMVVSTAVSVLSAINGD